MDQLSRTDALTGLFNRRHLDEELTIRHADARRHHEPLSLVLLDIDHFKRVNDTHGHSVGDIVLREFAKRLSHELRIGDIAGRWGGEEFLVILPRTDLGGAVEVAERIRAAIGATPFSAGTAQLAVAVSGGCSEGPGETPVELLHRVDTRLYQAKAAGRDQIAAGHLEDVPSSVEVRWRPDDDQAAFTVSS